MAASRKDASKRQFFERKRLAYPPKKRLTSQQGETPVLMGCCESLQTAGRICRKFAIVSSPNQRRRKAREFRIESLEERRLLVYDPIGWEPGQHASGFWSEQILNQAYHQNSNFSTEELALQQFSSKEETIESLHSIATEFWGDVLGEELDQDLWDEFQGARILPFPVIDPWFINEPIEFIPSIVATSDRAAGFSSSENSVRSTLPLSAHEPQESDLLGITDDNFMFLAQGHKVLVFDVSDVTNIERVTTIELGMFGHTDLYLTEQHLVSVNYNEAKVFDISDRASPEFLSSMQLQQIIDSRLVGDSLFLTTSGHVNLPRPQFIEAEWVDGKRVGLGDEAIGRFETVQEYVERIGESILAEFLPDVGWSSGLTQSITTRDIGDWQDIALGTTQFRSQQTSIIRLDLNGDNGPAITESETLQGIHASFMHFDASGIYVVSQENNLPFIDLLQIARPIFQPPGFNSNVFHFDFTEPLSANNDEVGGIDARHFAQVDGRVANANMLSGSDSGDLRVFSEAQTFEPITGESSTEANLSIFRSDGNSQLVKVSELRDVADGQALYSGLFVEDKAFATTAEVINGIPRWDPLHTFDLSDPLNPIEMSEIEIPGFTTQLEVASDNHLLGIGFSRDSFGQWHRQVALYDIGDLSSPSVVTNWVAPHTASDTWLNWWLNVRDIPFDPESGLLVVPMQDEFGARGNADGALIFEINTDDNPGVTELGMLAPNTHVRRAQVYDDHVIVAGEDRLQVYGLDKLESPTQTILLSNPLEPDFLTVERGAQIGLPVLSNDRVPLSAKIVTVTNAVAANAIRIADDGRSLIYSATDSQAFSDSITYVVEFEDGTQYSSSASLNIRPASPPPTTEEGSVKLILSAIDADGQALEQVQRGERFWLEISVEDTREFDEGVFGAYVDLMFDTEKFEIESDPTIAEPFTNGIRYRVEAGGITTVGGFSSELTPRGPGIQRLAQIELTALDSGSFDFLVTPSQQADAEVLLYGLNEAVHLENIETARLPLRVANSISEELADVNEDGGVTPQDALIIVNYLNQIADQARSGITTASLADAQQMTTMDISGDGKISPLDVLLIANIINAEHTAQNLVAGEAGSLHTFQLDTSDIEKNRSVWQGLDSTLNEDSSR